MKILNYIEVFSQVVKTGSFTAAAKHLGLSKSYVSKQISKLEDELGVCLLRRTTRKLSLSYEGKQFYQRCEFILAETNKAKSEAMDNHKNPNGLIKLTIPQSFVLSATGLALINFQKKYPDIELEIITSGNHLNLIEDSIDLALRIGELADSTMMYRKLMTCNFQVVASPKYIKKYGTPQTPKELEKHNCLIYNASSLNLHWPFKKNEEIITINPQGNLNCNDGQYILNSTIAGLGICFGPSIMFENHIKNKDLLLLLEDYYLPKVAISAIYPLNRNLPQRVKILIDYLHQELSQ